jgi:hypothetical protein
MNTEKHTEMVNFREKPSKTRRLEMLAKKQGLTVSDLLRKAVDWLLRKAA